MLVPTLMGRQARLPAICVHVGRRRRLSRDSGRRFAGAAPDMDGMHDRESRGLAENCSWSRTSSCYFSWLKLLQLQMGEKTYVFLRKTRVRPARQSLQQDTAVLPHNTPCSAEYIFIPSNLERC